MTTTKDFRTDFDLFVAAWIVGAVAVATFLTGDGLLSLRALLGK
jgi:hypothetical protein